jgi:hypothetical protein
MILRALCLENKQEDMSEKLEELISSMCRENLEDVPGLEELLEGEVMRDVAELVGEVVNVEHDE